jgi:muramoyltetrapeptide carboxypeptidase
LDLAGKFKDCVGIVLGECTDCIEPYGRTYEDLIEEFLVPLGKPLIKNFTTSHGDYKATTPIGALVNLDTFDNKITLMEPIASWSKASAKPY